MHLRSSRGSWRLSAQWGSILEPCRASPGHDRYHPSGRGRRGRTSVPKILQQPSSCITHACSRRPSGCSNTLRICGGIATRRASSRALSRSRSDTDQALTMVCWLKPLDQRSNSGLDTRTVIVQVIPNSPILGIDGRTSSLP